MEHKCQTCGMKCSDYRCDVCKTTASEHDPAHMHEGKNTCEGVCTGCQAVESKCSCKPRESKPQQ